MNMRFLLYASVIFCLSTLDVFADDIDSLCCDEAIDGVEVPEENLINQEEAESLETSQEEVAVQEETASEAKPMYEEVTISDVVLKPELVNLNQPLTLDLESATKKSVGDCYYNFKRDFSYMWVPIVAAGYIAKSQKSNFRQARHDFEPDFEHHLDDWLQHGPLALTFGLKFAGVEGRSDWQRYLVSGVLSYAVMGAIVNSIKYSAKEMRPDGSTANSFPSGHTATAFVAATILHKEYGLTRSPWYSVGGFAAATTTGVMRSLNNRHWISDIMVGAGIGILSTDLGYFLGDLIYKDKHIVRKELENLYDFTKHPSFFSIQMGATFTSNMKIPELSQWDCLMDQGGHVSLDGEKVTDDGKLRIGTGTAVAAEGAYFFNPYIGIGGRLKVMTAPVRANGLDYYDFAGYNRTEGNVSTDQLSMFSVDGGLYLQYPLSKRFAVGTKATFGGAFTSAIELEGSSIYEDSETGCGDYLYAESVRTMKFGTGLSLTYATKNNIAYKLNIDYDYVHMPFDFEYEPAYFGQADRDVRIYSTQIKHNMNMLTIGASMAIRF